MSTAAALALGSALVAAGILHLRFRNGIADAHVRFERRYGPDSYREADPEGQRRYALVWRVVLPGVLLLAMGAVLLGYALVAQV